MAGARKKNRKVENLVGTSTLRFPFCTENVQLSQLLTAQRDRKVDVLAGEQPGGASSTQEQPPGLSGAGRGSQKEHEGDRQERPGRDRVGQVQILY